MMTGTPIESNVWMAYLLTVFLVVTGFAVYDILYRRVPDRALVFFIPLAALAPLIQVYFILEYDRMPIFIWPVVAEALVGALLGFCIPLAAAMATGGSGMGGGDIKFCGVLGLVYGPSGMALVFLVAAGLPCQWCCCSGGSFGTNSPLRSRFYLFWPAAALWRRWLNYFYDRRDAYETQ